MNFQVIYYLVSKRDSPYLSEKFSASSYVTLRRRFRSLLQPISITSQSGGISCVRTLMMSGRHLKETLLVTSYNANTPEASMKSEV